MATRSQLQFGYVSKNRKFKRIAQVYHHWDGYPSNRLLDIEKTIKLAHKMYRHQGGFEYRIANTYPSDFAAFYILANKDGSGNVEIDEYIHGDIEYLYQIWQDDKSKEIVVKILTTHNPDGEFDEDSADVFWQNPTASKMYTYDVGSLDSLIEKYCNKGVKE